MMPRLLTFLSFLALAAAVLGTRSLAEDGQVTSALPNGMAINAAAPAPTPTQPAATPTPANESMAATLRNAAAGMAAAAAALSGTPNAPLQAQDINTLAKGTVFRLDTMIEKANAAASHGSAFVIDRAGLLITNYHVVQDALLGGAGYRLLLVVPEGTTPAVVVAVDLVNDIALVRTGRAFDNALQIASRTASEAELVYSLGYPGDEKLTFAQGNFNGESVNGFSMSGFASLPLNPGMSGGPLMNSRAEVIGVNRAIVRSAQNLSFFSPLAALQELIAKHAGGGRTLASITGNWKKEAVEMVQKHENRAIFGKSTSPARQRLGDISFTVPLANQTCGQSTFGGKEDAMAGDFFICQSRSLTPLVGESHALEVTTYALASTKTAVKLAAPLFGIFRRLYEKERIEILRGSRTRRPAALTPQEWKDRENCTLKNVKNNNGVEMTVSLCSVANAFFDGLFSTFVKVDVHGASANSTSLVQVYQGLTAPATADVLGQFLESVQTEGGS